MNLLQALILGLVQGLTEFLPISSSGHLVLFNHFLDVNLDNITFEVAVHVGTLFSVIIYFRNDLLNVIRDFIKGGEYRKVGWMLILAMVPTVIIGLGFKDIIEGLFQSPKFAAGGLIFTSAILFLAEKVKPGVKSLTRANWLNAIIIGTFQGLAIIPGISRSGSTISAGIFTNMERDAAARFSFLLSIPAILGAATLMIKDFTVIEPGLIGAFIVGFFASLVSGYLAIGILMRIIRKGKLYGFSIYTLVVGLTGLILLPV